VARHINPAGTKADAIFLGWQKTLSGECFPLFNIIVADHPLYQSTVSDATLQRLNLRVPRTSSPYPEVRPAPWNNPAIELDCPQTALQQKEV
jgi:hypothetical protein